MKPKPIDAAKIPPEVQRHEVKGQNHEAFTLSWKPVAWRKHWQPYACGRPVQKTMNDSECKVHVETHQIAGYSVEIRSLEGLAGREAGGARAYVAVFGNRFLDEWTFVRFHSGELQPSQSYSITPLRPYRDRELERAVAKPFADAVLAHADAAARGGQHALDEVLAAHPQYRRA